MTNNKETPIYSLEAQSQAQDEFRKVAEVAITKHIESSIKNCKKQVETCKEQVKDCEGMAEDCCEDEIKDCKDNIKYCEGMVKRYKKIIKDWKNDVKDSETISFERKISIMIDLLVVKDKLITKDINDLIKKSSLLYSKYLKK